MKSVIHLEAPQVCTHSDAPPGSVSDWPELPDHMQLLSLVILFND